MYKVTRKRGKKGKPFTLSHQAHVATNWLYFPTFLPPTEPLEFPPSKPTPNTPFLYQLTNPFPASYIKHSSIT